MEATPAALTEIALDLRWSWNHSADELWRRLEPDLWDDTRNAWVVLQTVSRKRLTEAFADSAFLAELNSVLREREESAARARWFGEERKSALNAVAYFSLEFMLSEALPIYSGGLGNVAGDQLKAADDLGVPVIGIGLLYSQGYFRQYIDGAGRQFALRPVNDTGQLPISPVRDAEGEWLRIPIAVPGARVWVRIWWVRLGQRVLYLLDTNDAANLPEHRGITSELYGGGPELRIEQERILGIAGWRLMRLLGIQPEVCHLNEGHAAFAVLERARDYMAQTGVPFAAALAVTRAGNIFTTHTPVAAGFDQFAPDLVTARMREYAETELGISLGEFLALGREEGADDRQPFNMAYLAVRGSGAINGVSRLHGEVSRRIFQPLFPRWPQAEVPVRYVTNGVHTPTWDSEESDAVWTKLCGKDRWKGEQECVGANLRKTETADLWRMRNTERRSLVEYVRQRLARQIAGHGGLPEEAEQARRVLDADTLTLGFARRFATYKRPTLLLRDPDRLLRILTNRRMPVQLILAGKAHPADGEGQELIRQWIEFIRGTAARSQAVFLSDYDMQMAQQIVQGVDLWLNTPRRPWEASGTSGMKVLANGGLNFSELDGWWAEAWADQVGWALGDGREHDADASWDDAEAERLYDLLEHEIVPAFYARDARGMPQRWLDRVLESMARLTPVYSANRVVREYTDKHYIPAAKAYRERARDGGHMGAELVNWRREVELHWQRLRFGAMHVEPGEGELTFTVQANLDELNPDFASVELFADAAEPGGEPVIEKMTRGPALVGSENGFTWSKTVKTSRPAADFTPRLVPAYPGALVPLECDRVLWYR